MIADAIQVDSLSLIMLSSGFFGGFGHCIGMCGPVVAAYSLRAEGGRLLPPLLYHIGRITTYSLLGGIMGFTGSFVSVMKAIERYQYLAMGIFGAMMIVMGLSLGGWLPLGKREQLSPGFPNLAIRVVKYLSQEKTSGVFFPIGLTLGFLPCGLLYTALIAAAGAGAGAAHPAAGFLQGMFMLSLFGAGTVPALLLVGRIAVLAGERIRSGLYRLSAGLMIVAGMILLSRSLI